MPRKKKSNLSQYSIMRRKAKLKRMQETPEQREARLAREREHQTHNRSIETPAHREERLYLQRTRIAALRKSKNQQKRQARLSSVRSRQAMAQVYQWPKQFHNDQTHYFNFPKTEDSMHVTETNIKCEFVSDVSETEEN